MVLGGLGDVFINHERHRSSWFIVNVPYASFVHFIAYLVVQFNPLTSVVQLFHKNPR